MELYGVDVSGIGQGTINWDELNAASNFVIIQATYGTITDAQFSRNQSEARRVQVAAGPLGIGYYHYAYARLLDAVTSANYFADVLGALQEGELLALDWEEPYNGDHVAWCLQWLQTVEARTSVKPLLYLNQALMNSHDWSPVINAGYGLWLAKYDDSKTATAPTTPWPVVAIRQWVSTDVVAGISGYVDGDTAYVDFNGWNAYGYHATNLAPVPLPEPDPIPQPPVQPTPVDPVPVPEPTLAPTPEPPEPTPSPSPVVSPPIVTQPSTSNWLVVLLKAISSWFKSLRIHKPSA